VRKKKGKGGKLLGIVSHVKKKENASWGSGQHARFSKGQRTQYGGWRKGGRNGASKKKGGYMGAASKKGDTSLTKYKFGKRGGKRADLA